MSDLFIVSGQILVVSAVVCGVWVWLERRAR